jgi:hypothetical protein
LPCFFCIDVGDGASLLLRSDVFVADRWAARAASCAGDGAGAGRPLVPVSLIMFSPMPLRSMSAPVRPLAPRVPCAAGEDGDDVEYVDGLDVLPPECEPLSW